MLPLACQCCEVNFAVKYKISSCRRVAKELNITLVLRPLVRASFHAVMAAVAVDNNQSPMHRQKELSKKICSPVNASASFVKENVFVCIGLW